LVVKNAKIVNVLSGDVHEANVAIADGIFLGFEDDEAYNTKNLYNVQGRYMCPGLVDGHIHIESPFSPHKNFVKQWRIMGRRLQFATHTK
jgi:adenine deaminase